ncbi:DUF362 domain-containing protein [Candidatus Bathyarchaeota archaeon]|nr:DUF362 domain-containing protein [Candidatus Bathyarchaeota archaeon]
MAMVHAAVISDAEQDMKRTLKMLELPEKASNIGIKIATCDYRRSETGATTDPTVLDALIKTLRSKYSSCEIFVFENDASGTNAETLFRYLGIDEIAKRHDCRTVSLSKTDWVPKKIDGFHFKET